MRSTRFGFADLSTSVRAGFVVALLLACTAAGRAQQAAVDLNCHPVNPLAEDSGKMVVLVFLRRDCPVSSRYAPVIQEISKRYSQRARFWLVYPDKTDSPPAIGKYLDDYAYRLPALRDPEHTLVKLARVQITPEVAVFDRGHQLVYDGRIDDRYVDLARARPAATTPRLDEAIPAGAGGEARAQKG